MRAFGVLVAFGCALAQQAAKAAPPPAEAFASLPPVGLFALSPDGRSLAWEDNRGERAGVVVYDIDSGRQKRAFPIAAKNTLYDIRWADDATLLVELGVTHTSKNKKRSVEWFRTVAVDVGTGDSRPLLTDDPDSQSVVRPLVLATRTGTPHTITMSTWDYRPSVANRTVGVRTRQRRSESGWVNCVFSVDVRTGKGSLLEYGTEFTDEWVVDEAGRPLARSEWYPSLRKYEILARRGAEWKTIYAEQDGDRLNLLTKSPDGRSVIAVGAGGEKSTKLWSIPLDGSGVRVLFEHPSNELGNVYLDPITKVPVAVQIGISPQLQWLDEKLRTRHEALSRTFPERDVRILSRSESYERVVVVVDSLSHPQTYFLVDFRTGKADIVGEANPDLANARLGEVRTIAYRTRDNYSIPAFLTLPVGVGEKNLPMVVLPHDGPDSRDYPTFDWWAQFLASRGYAVLQPQYRGSTGLGWAHRDAGLRQWGGLMQNDLTDGVKALIDEGFADPRRVCIVGIGYGGYAALAGAAFTPDLYACAVSINGLSDLPAFLHYVERRGDLPDSDALFYWREHIGPKHDPAIAARSPARAAALVKAPVLLIHGVADPDVPIAQAEMMHKALTALLRPVKFVTLQGDDHWLLASETRVQVLKELESFLAEHLSTVP